MGEMKELMIRVAGESVRIVGKGRLVPCLLYDDHLVLFGESEESLRRSVKEFGRVYKRRDIKVNVDKN